MPSDPYSSESSESDRVCTLLLTATANYAGTLDMLKPVNDESDTENNTTGLLGATETTEISTAREILSTGSLSDLTLSEVKGLQVKYHNLKPMQLKDGALQSRLEYQKFE